MSVEMYLEDQCSITGLSDVSMEDLNEIENVNFFSDPESEWNASLNSTEKSDRLDSRPESDQPSLLQSSPAYMKPYKVPTMSYENLDEL